MYNCQLCDKSFKWPQNLNRHIKTLHHNTSEKMDTNSKPSYEGEDMQHSTIQHSCHLCGALYKDSESLLKHIDTCRADDDDDPDSDDEDESHSIWKDMVQQVYDENNDDFQEILETYESQGVENAREKALEDMRPVYKRHLQKLFAKVFKYPYYLSMNEDYETIEEDFNYFYDEKGYNYQKALRLLYERMMVSLKNFWMRMTVMQTLMTMMAQVMVKLKMVTQEMMNKAGKK